MSTEITIKPESGIDADALQQVIMGGDLSRLSPAQKVQYYARVCELVGLNPLTKPFDYMKLNGKEILYANKGCAEQLRMRHQISVKIINRETIDGVYVVTVEAAGKDGRVDSSTGAVPIAGLKGETLANAFLKCETKAKRRVTLSICGLNMLDETEVESIKPNPLGIHPEQPMEGDGNQNPDMGYRIDFGQWNRRSIEEVYRNFGPEKIIAYINYLESAAEKKGQTIEPDGKAGIFIKHAHEFLAAMENEPQEQDPNAFDGDWK